MSEIDKLALDSSIPHLASLPGVLVVGDWEPATGSAVWTLRIQVSIPDTLEDIASTTDWLVVVDFADDAWGKVKLYPGTGSQAIATTFPHQQFNGAQHKILPCRTGFICTDLPTFQLAASRNAKLTEPVDTLGRIVWHVERCVIWVAAAAAGTLTAPGDKFELPDFNTGDQLALTLGYQETPSSFQTWNDPVRVGIVELGLTHNYALLTKQFLDKKAKNSIYQPQWGTFIQNTHTTYGIWLRLDKVPVTGQWQAPSTFRELNDICAQQGIDLAGEVGSALPAFLGKPTMNQLGCILLIGMPVAEIIGEPASQYHWQALEIMPARQAPANKAQVLSTKVIESQLLTRLKANTAIKWLTKSENWSSAELLKRGSASRELCNAKVVMIGAGALGSALASQLVRMGVSELTLIDSDLMESGNLVRHQLGIDGLNQFKVNALANALNLSNPSARTVGLPYRFPSDKAEVISSLSEASIIIDCSAEDAVLVSVEEKLAGRTIPIVSCSLGLHAKRLFLYAADANQFSWSDFDQWFHPFRQQEEALLNDAQLPQGIGCWHPLFPAQFNRVEGLSAVALEYIDQIYQRSTLVSPIRICYDWPDLTLGI